ncbi:hypothetical protein BU15DRAFT_57671, partial [Melanogaster broomeanus]
KNDDRVHQILREYPCSYESSPHQPTITVEHNIRMSPTTVTRRRKDLNLQANGATTRLLSSVVKRQLVLDELAQDPLNRRGPRTVREGIAATSGMLPTRFFFPPSALPLDGKSICGQKPTMWIA